MKLLNVHKSFGRGAASAMVLRGVSIDVTAEGMIALVGPSGCGKSTLLNLVGGLDQPDSGSIVVDGLDLARASRRQLNDFRQQKVGFIFQFFNLLPTLTVFENVMVALDVLPMESAERTRRAKHYLEAVGLGDRGDVFPSTLSGGQQQRVSVARALAKEPRILLADEPTGNLDQASGQVVFELIQGLQRRLGITCLLVTHDPALAKKADRIVRMVDGTIVDDEHHVAESAPARMVGSSA